MITQKQLEQIGNKYLTELKAQGRKFNKIVFEVKSRKSTHIYGTAYMTNERLGYDRITINPHMPDQNEFINTLLHELAHLDLEARGNGHGAKWKKVARLYSSLYNTNITRSSHKSLAIPGSIQVKVVWTDKCLKINKNLDRNYTRTYTSQKLAENFVKKYESIGFIQEYKIIKI